MTAWKIATLTALLLLDVLVVTPWLTSLAAAPEGVARAWAFLIPLITSLAGSIGGAAAKKVMDKKANASAQDEGFIDADSDPNQGFDWGAAAPYLGAAGGLATGMLLNKKKKASTTNSPLDQLLAFQNQRMMAAEPLNQSGLAMATSMMPSHMKAQGGGMDQWLNQHAAANQRALQQPPQY